MDILFTTEQYVFSYRVAGICIQNGKILLQKPKSDTAFSFPGGHVGLGETNAETLLREFHEEIGADISVGDLRWVGEIFFPWGNKPCHQICLYHTVNIISDNIPKDGVFTGKEEIDGRKFNLEFHWIPLDELKNIEVYPTNAEKLISQLENGVQYFIDKNGER